MSDFSQLAADALHAGTCLMLVLSRRRKDRTDVPERLTIRPVALAGELTYQFAARAGLRETHKNLPPVDAANRVTTLFPDAYEDAYLYTPDADTAARRRPDGRVKLRRSPPSRRPADTAHNRAKQYLIPEGVPCPFLIEIGVMTPAGQVKAQKTHKFRQINRFLELVNDGLDALPTEGELNVVDFGCGKSYLTFALHHLLTNIRGRAVRIIGLDRNADVIRTCRQVAGKLDCAGLEFRTGDIAAHQPPGKVHLAVSLHACDTATDAALAQAVAWDADVILAVPCCQHELASNIASHDLRALLGHGILKERFAALATDALRAEMLERCGYRTQVVEFIDLEHTPKNLLIRSIRRREPDPHRAERTAALNDLKQLLGLESFALERLLEGRFMATRETTPTQTNDLSSA